MQAPRARECARCESVLPAAAANAKEARANQRARRRRRGPAGPARGDGPRAEVHDAAPPRLTARRWLVFSTEAVPVGVTNHVMWNALGISSRTHEIRYRTFHVTCPSVGLERHPLRTGTAIGRSARRD